MLKLKFVKKAQTTVVTEKVPDWVITIAYLLLAIFIVVMIRKLMASSI